MTRHYDISERVRQVRETYNLIEHVLNTRQMYSLELARFDLQFALEYIRRGLEAKLSPLHSKAL